MLVRFIATGLLAVLLTGCSYFEKKEPEPKKLVPEDKVVSLFTPALQDEQQNRILYFASKNADLNYITKRFLASHIQYLKEHPDAQITLHGFADVSGSEHNQRLLGWQRSEVIAAYLKDHGIEPDRIVLVPPEESLSTDEPTGDQRPITNPLKRRVEISYHLVTKDLDEPLDVLEL